MLYGNIVGTPTEHLVPSVQTGVMEFKVHGNANNLDTNHQKKLSLSLCEPAAPCSRLKQPAQACDGVDLLPRAPASNEGTIARGGSP